MSTRNNGILYIRSVKSSSKQTSVNVTAVKLWNNLEQDIRDNVSLNDLKKNIKWKIISRY